MRTKLKSKKRSTLEFPTGGSKLTDFFISGEYVNEQVYIKKWTARVKSHDPNRFQSRFPKFVPKSALQFKDNG